MDYKELTVEQLREQRDNLVEDLEKSTQEFVDWTEETRKISNNKSLENYQKSVDIENLNNLIAKKEFEMVKEYQLDYLKNNTKKYFFKYCCGEIYIFNANAAYMGDFYASVKGIKFAISKNDLSVYNTADVRYDEFLHDYAEVDKEVVDKIISLINVKDAFINNNFEDIYNKVIELLPKSEVDDAE